MAPLSTEAVTALSERLNGRYRTTFSRWRAAKQLAGDTSPAAAQALALALTRPKLGRRTEAIVHAALTRVSDQNSIDAVCAVRWRHLPARRHRFTESLDHLLAARGWIAAGNARVRTLSALHVDRGDVLVDDTAETAKQLLRVIATGEDPLRGRASTALVAMRRQRTRDSVCTAAIVHGNPAALRAAIDGDFLPKDPARRALLLYLAKRHCEHKELDPHGALLAAAYARAHQRVRDRVADDARALDRLDWLRAALDALPPDDRNTVSIKE
jgi:hypothetical protein